MTVENINLLIYGSGKNQIQSIIKLQTNLNPDKMNMKNNSQHRKIKNYNKNSMNEDDFDYEYDEDYNTSTEENWHFQEMGVSSVLFLMELYGTIYGLSYGIFAQINYFFHVNVIKDREPEHLGSYNNNITIANS
ncbi:uncharacterized protein LOC142330187 [Lycorma delicatula]|uniref:uncharacterized protein LOC142330187 n=1 Tax=Lycorma delicatula TaxID=130591 RepID=UPI003F514DB6